MYFAGVSWERTDCLSQFQLYNKVPQTEGLYKQQTFIPPSCGAWLSEIRVPAGWRSGENLLVAADC